MSTFHERYGSAVAGLPLRLRLLLTGMLCFPAGFALLALVVTAGEWRALVLAVAVLSAFPAYVLVPALWVRTDESVTQDWGARELERRLRLELDGPETDDHPSLRDREPPTRW